MKTLLDRARRTPPVLYINVVLIALILGVALAPKAGARQPDRPRGAYSMVAGTIQGGNNDVLYVIDSINQELVAVSWDTARGNLSVVGHRNLANDARQRGER